MTPIPRNVALGLVLASAAAAGPLRAESPAPPNSTAAAADQASEPATSPGQQLDDAWNQLSLREKKQLLNLQRTLKTMPADERARIRQRIEHFQQMSPQEQDQLRQNRERWSKMTAEQRDRARQLYRERRHRFEEQWRREHPGEEPPPFGVKPPPAAEPTAPAAPAAESQTQTPKEERTQE